MNVYPVSVIVLLLFYRYIKNSFDNIVFISLIRICYEGITLITLFHAQFLKLYSFHLGTLLTAETILHHSSRKRWQRVGW